MISPWYSEARGVRVRGEKVMLAPPPTWAFFARMWGIFVLTPYWLIHRSSLREPPRSV